MAADLVIKINGDISNFQDALEKARNQTEALDEALSKVAKVSAGIFAVLVAEMGYAIHQFGDAEKSANQLNTALINQGLSVQKLSPLYKQYAKELEALTGVDDDAVVGTLAVMQGMIGQMEITKDMTLAIADLAAAKKMDLDSTAELIAKGVNGHTVALQKLGITIDEHLTKSQRYEQIIQKIEGAYAGQAKATSDAAFGTKQLGAVLGDIQEDLGARFAPMLKVVTGYLTEFLSWIEKNEGILNFVSALIAGGAAIAGMISGLAALGLAFNAATAAATAMGFSLTAALGPIGLVAAGVAAIAYALGRMAIASSKTKDPIVEMQDDLARFRQRLDEAKATMEATPKNSDFFKAASQNAELLKEKIADVEERLRRMQSAQNKRTPEQDAADAAKAEADKRERLERERERREMEAQRVHLKLMELQIQEHNQAVMDLAQQEGELTKAIADKNNESIVADLERHLEVVRVRKEEAYKTEQQQQATFYELLFDDNEEFQAMTMEQKGRFLQDNMAQLRETIMTEEQVRQKAAVDRTTQQIKANNDFLINQQKFGTAYAMINKIMHSEIYEGSKQAFGDLAALQTSSNSTLKSIGKVAALANIAIKTAESAMNIYAGFSTIPIIGPALGVAGAAAAVAFGVEQAGKVTAAADGGLMTGGIPGRDSIPTLTMPGELVVPTRNFDEVVGAVAAQRTGAAAGSEGEGAYARLDIHMVGDKFIENVEARIVARQRLNISLLRS